MDMEISLKNTIIIIIIIIIINYKFKLLHSSIWAKSKNFLITSGQLRVARVFDYPSLFWDRKRNEFWRVISAILNIIIFIRYHPNLDLNSNGSVIIHLMPLKLWFPQYYWRFFLIFINHTFQPPSLRVLG